MQTLFVNYATALTFLLWFKYLKRTKLQKKMKNQKFFLKIFNCDLNFYLKKKDLIFGR